MNRRWMLLIAGLVVLALISVGASALVQAGPPAQGPSSEAGYQAPDKGAVPADEGVQPDEDDYKGPVVDTGASTGAPSGEGDKPADASATVAGDPQPDEDGYSGPLPAANITDDGASSGVVDAVPPDWKDVSPGPWLDEDDYYDGVDGADGWSPFYYKYVAGSTLRPRDSANGWDDDGSGGCLSVASGSTLGIFNIDLNLPEGSRIDYLRIYYYDTSASDSRSWLTTYDGAGGVDDLVGVSSDGNGGYGTELSLYMGDEVDNYTKAYVLNWRPYQLGSTMRLCGLRVAYRLPN